MKRLISISMFAALALAGCGGDKVDEAISGMKGHADKMCGCEKDKDPAACAEKVHADKEKWEDGMEKKMEGAKPNADQMKKWEEAEDRYRECRTKAELGGGGGE